MENGSAEDGKPLLKSLKELMNQVQENISLSPGLKVFLKKWLSVECLGGSLS